MMSTDNISGKIQTLLYFQKDWDTVRDWAFRDGSMSLAVTLESLDAADCITAVLNAMAQRALEIWPRWYGGGVFAKAASSSLAERMHSFLAAIEFCRQNRNVEPAWLKKAIHLVSTGRAPSVPGIVGEIQIHQLALALTGCVSCVRVAVVPTRGELHGYSGFPRAVEWIARESGLDVTVLLSKETVADEGLAPLLYSAGDWRDTRLAEGSHDAAGVRTESPPEVPAFQPAPRIPDEDAPEALRIIGAPHPRSKGEQLLAKRLLCDPQLSGLFGHNQPVNTRCGRRFIVDLLWQAGGVVVEIDGYHYHNNSIAFAGDRDRDYRLLLSGYRVLRLTHDEVVRDTELAMEKIRDVVNFVRQTGSEADNVR